MEGRSRGKDVTVSACDVVGAGVVRCRCRRVMWSVQELLGVEEEKDSGDEEGQEHDESSEYEEYSGSEEEDTGPRLKPVFVRKYALLRLL